MPNELVLDKWNAPAKLWQYLPELEGKHMSASKGFFERNPYLYLDTS